MGYRYDEFAPGEVYHVFSRGVEQRKIFLSSKDKERFLKLLLHYLPPATTMSFSNAAKLKSRPTELADEGEGLVDILCYCLMDNHFHMLLRENTEKGVSTYMRRVLNAYAKYFNLKQNRSGPLFLHPFKAVLVDRDEQLLHTSRYIHLNPYAAQMIQNPFQYQWSSLYEYIEPTNKAYCHTSLINGMMEPEEYQEFVKDQAGYLDSLVDYKHLLIDYED